MGGGAAAGFLPSLCCSKSGRFVLEDVRLLIGYANEGAVVVDGECLLGSEAGWEVHDLLGGLEVEAPDHPSLADGQGAEAVGPHATENLPCVHLEQNLARRSIHVTELVVGRTHNEII